MDFKGKYLYWNLGPKEKHRTFTVLTVQYGTIREFLTVKRFNLDGEGYQRETTQSWVNKLSSEFSSGNFSPTVFYANTNSTHNIHKQEGIVTLDLNSENPLEITDAQHRLNALEIIRNTNIICQNLVDELPVVILVNLNGNPATDFLNYQRGRPVHKNHMVGLKIMNEQIPPDKNQLYQTGYQLAKSLAFFRYKISFFDGANSNTIPVYTLLPNSSSEIGNSLIGSAALIVKFNKTNNDYLDFFKETVLTLESKIPILFVNGHLFCGPPKGSRTYLSLLIGLVNLLFYKSLTENDFDLNHHLSTIQKVYERSSTGLTALPKRREILKMAGESLFTNLSTDLLHHKIPIGLIKIWSSSCFGIPMMTREKTKKVLTKKVADSTISAEPNDLEPLTEGQINAFFRKVPDFC